MKLISDTVFEQSISQKLAEAQGLAQNVLNEWNTLSLGPVNGHVALFELIHQTQVPFDEAVNRLRMPAEGIDPKLASEHAANVQVPYPERLLKAAEVARRNGYLSRELGLVNIDKSGKKVELVQQVAKSIIESRTVYSENDAQEKYFAELQGLIEQLNKLNNQAGGKLLVNNSRTLAPIFQTPAREVPGYYDVQLEPSELRILLQHLK